jgi:hypothetical protein
LKRALNLFYVIGKSLVVSAIVWLILGWVFPEISTMVFWALVMANSMGIYIGVYFFIHQVSKKFTFKTSREQPLLVWMDELTDLDFFIRKIYKGTLSTDLMNNLIVTKKKLTSIFGTNLEDYKLLKAYLIAKDNDSYVNKFRQLLFSALMALGIGILTKIKYDTIYNFVLAKFSEFTFFILLMMIILFVSAHIVLYVLITNENKTRNILLREVLDICISEIENKNKDNQGKFLQRVKGEDFCRIYGK